MIPNDGFTIHEKSYIDLNIKNAGYPNMMLQKGHRRCKAARHCISCFPLLVQGGFRSQIIFLTPGTNVITEASKKLPTTAKGATTKNFNAGSTSKFLNESARAISTRG